MNMETENQTLLYDVVSNSRFVVPQYQRSYQWEDSQVNDFVDDILHLTNEYQNKQNINHYFGTLVLGSNGKYKWSRSNTVKEYEVIDGQQRLTTTSLFMIVLAEELTEIANAIDNNNLGKEAEDIANDIFTTYAGEEKSDGFKYRISPGERTTPAYKNAIRIEKELTIDNNNLSSRRIKNARKVLKSRVASWREEHINQKKISDGSEDDLSAYIDYLIEVVSVVNNRLVVTTNIVESINDAARMFKVINERGKDISLFDRVKSHMIYCASQCDSPTEEISKLMKDAAEQITIQPNTSEETVDGYVRIHWTIWTGDYKAKKRSRNDSIAEMIQQDSRYADPDRDDIKMWIENYVDSFHKLVQHYIDLRSPENFLKNDPEDNWKTQYVADRLYGIKTSGRDWQVYLPSLVAAKHQFGYQSEEFLQYITALESFVFRYDHVIKNGGTIDSNVGQGAYEIFWSDVNNNVLQETFNQNPRITINFQSSREAITALTNGITEIIRDRPDNELFVEQISEDDVLEGNSRRNWGGFRSKQKTTKYLLHEYEKHLRQKYNLDLDTIQPIHEWINSHDLEFIQPNETTADGQKISINNLGNIAVINKQNSNQTKNSPLEYNIESYNKSDLKMLNIISEQHDEWDQEAIQERLDKIVEFVKKRWSADSKIKRPNTVKVDTPIK